MPEHVTLTDPNLHEPKGASTATSNETYVSDGLGSGAWAEPELKGASSATLDQVYVSDGAGAGSFKNLYTSGWEDYDDAATSGTPIALTLAATEYKLTNDGLGPVTDVTYRLPGNTAIWDTSTNQFDFSSLNVGDFVTLRVDITPTTGGANHELTLRMNFAIGGAIPFSLLIQKNNIKTASTSQITRYFSFFIGGTDVRDNPAELTMECSNTGATVIVQGWLCATTPVSPVYV